MLWFFDRADESLTVEARYEGGTSEFVFIARCRDGRERTKRFRDAEAFAFWLQAFEQHLTAEHWSNRGQPTVLPHGWRDRSER